MRWYEYKMEADDLHAPEDLKAKLLAMADTLPEEEKNRPTGRVRGGLRCHEHREAGHRCKEQQHGSVFGQ